VFGLNAQNASKAEPFAKVLEWFNSQVSMEEVYRFPLLRLKPSNVPPPFVIPAKAGIQRRANGKTRGKTQRLESRNRANRDLAIPGGRLLLLGRLRELG
jgi:hypothetical protein